MGFASLFLVLSNALSAAAPTDVSVFKADAQARALAGPAHVFADPGLAAPWPQLIDGPPLSRNGAPVRKGPVAEPAGRWRVTAPATVEAVGADGAESPASPALIDAKWDVVESLYHMEFFRAHRLDFGELDHGSR